MDVVDVASLTAKSMPVYTPEAMHVSTSPKTAYQKEPKYLIFTYTSLSEFKRVKEEPFCLRFGCVHPFLRSPSLSIKGYVRPSIHSSIRPFIHPSVHPSVLLSVFPSVRRSVHTVSHSRASFDGHLKNLE